MDISTVCRTCLNKDNLNPIFKNDGDYRKCLKALYSITGIKVNADDGLPQQMCSACVEFINQSLIFRKTCKHTETHLMMLQDMSQNKSKHNRNEFINTEHFDNVTCYIKEELFQDDSDSESDDKLPLKYLIKDIKQIKKNKFAATEIQDMKNEWEAIEVTSEPLVEKELTSANTEDTLQALSEATTVNTNDNEICIRSMSNKDRVTCELCQRELSVRSLRSHMTNIHGAESARETAQCELCQRELSVRSLRSHMTNIHGAESARETAQCDVCHRRLLRENLPRHRDTHHGGNQLACHRCKTQFDNKESLQEHFKTCLYKNRKKSQSCREMVRCEVCGKRMQRASLRLHRDIKHRGMGPVCEHCGARPGNKLRLAEHLRAKHGYDKYQCQLCRFQSSSALSMANHERRHRGEKPFVCERCGASFHAGYLLAQHRHSHRTDRPYQCQHCPARFKANNGLHIHRAACHAQLTRTDNWARTDNDCTRTGNDYIRTDTMSGVHNIVETDATRENLSR